MSPRDRRLAADLHRMKEAAAQGRFSYQAIGSPPETYTVTIDVKGIALEDRRIVRRTEHRFEIYLHRDYPRRPPVVTWQTPIYHPNILGPEGNGGVCIGAWTASEGLDDLIDRLVALVAYRDFNVQDSLDTDAASWVDRSSLEPGFDLDEVVGITVRRPDQSPVRVVVRS